MILPPQPPPNRPKMASSSAKMAQDRSKTAPRPPQDDFEALLFASSFLSSIWVRSGSNLGSISHPLGRPKRPPNRTQKRPKIMLPQDGLQDRSKTAPDPPQGAPRPPQTPPDSLLGAPQDPSRTPTDAPRGSPKGTRIISSYCFVSIMMIMSLIMTIAMTARRMVIMIARTNMMFQHMANTRLQYHDD